MALSFGSVIFILYLCKVNLKQQAMKNLFNKIKDAKRIGLYMKWFNNKQIKIY